MSPRHLRWCVLVKPRAVLTPWAAQQNAQIFRVSLGTFVTEYPCQVLELGLRSTLGIQIRGQTNMREVNSDYGSIDQAACIAHGNNVANNQTLVVQNFPLVRSTHRRRGIAFPHPLQDRG